MIHFCHFLLFLLFPFFANSSLQFRNKLHLDPNTRQLRDLVVVVGEELEGQDCKNVVRRVRKVMEEASRVLHTSLGGRVMVGRVVVQVPQTWGDVECGSKVGGSWHKVGFHQTSNWAIVCLFVT